MKDILGLIIIYSWVHAMIIISKNLKVKGYDKVVIIVATVAFVLTIIGVMFG